MAAFFKKKPKKKKEQEAAPQDVEAQSVLPEETKPEKPKKKKLFGKKEKTEKKQKKEKAPKKKRVRKEKKKKEKARKGPKLSRKEKKRAAREQQAATAVAEPGEIVAEAAAIEKDTAKKGKKRRLGKKTEKKEKKDVKAKKKDRKKKQKVKKEKAPKEKKPKKKKKQSFGGSKLSPIGLDIGRTSLTAVKLRHQTAGSTLLSVVMDRIPEGLIQEGEVRDVEALASAIKKFWKSYKIKGRKVNLGLANQKIVVRIFEFPILEEKELRSAIDLQAQDYIPIPMDQAVIDFHVLGRFTDDEGIEKQKVLVVAAQKEMVMDFIEAAKKAKLAVAGIDLQAFAMLRSLVSVSFLDEKTQAGQAIAVANIASDVTNLVVDVGGEPQFTRIISFGGDDFTRSVQEQTGVSYKKAEQLKAITGLLHPSEIVDRGSQPEEKPEMDTDIEPPSPGLGAPGEVPSDAAPPADEVGDAGQHEQGSTHTEEEDDDDTPLGDVDEKLAAATRRALEITTESFAEEIRRSLDYYQSQEESLPVGKMLLSGGGAMLRNLDAHLANVFPFPVELGNPLMRISQNKTDLSDEELSAIAPHLAIAIGLALEEEV